MSKLAAESKVATQMGNQIQSHRAYRIVFMRRWPAEIRHHAIAEMAVRFPFFEARLRRYRGERLYSLAAPEDRARELARELLVYGETGGLGAGMEEMTVERLRAAVERLSAPIVLFLGPFQDETG